MARRRGTDAERNTVFVGVSMTEQEKRQLEQLRQRLTNRNGMPINTAQAVRYLINNTKLEERG